MQLGQLKNLSYEQVKKLYESNRISKVDWDLYCIYRGDMTWPIWKGARVAQFREIHHLTQFELACILNIDAATIARWESHPNELIPILGCIAMTHVNLFWPEARQMMMDSKAKTLTSSIRAKHQKENAKVSLYQHTLCYYCDQFESVGLLVEKIGKRAPIDAERIISLRSKLVMTREEFADFLDTSVSTIDKWETNKSLPTGPANMLLRLLEQDQKRSFQLEEAMQILDRVDLEFLTQGILGHEEPKPLTPALKEELMNGDKCLISHSKRNIHRKYAELKDLGALNKKIGKRDPISAERIVRLRSKLAMTREQFADFLDISIASVVNWEKGKTVPNGPANVLLRLLELDQKESFALKQAMQLLDRGGLEFPRQAKK